MILNVFTFDISAMEASIQKVRRKDAQAVPSTLFPRCVQYPGIGQISLPHQSLDVWHLRQILLSRTLLGNAH